MSVITQRKSFIGVDTTVYLIGWRRQWNIILFVFGFPVAVLVISLLKDGPVLANKIIRKTSPISKIDLIKVIRFFRCY